MKISTRGALRLGIACLVCVIGNVGSAEQAPPWYQPLMPQPRLLPDDSKTGSQPWVSVRRSFGDGVGYGDGYTRAEGFAPLWEYPGQTLYFTEGRLVSFDESESWQVNYGGGYRTYCPEWDALIGWNAFYDGRTTDIHYYQQAGVGFEFLGERWEARGNAYIPVGPQRFETLDTGFFDIGFSGRNIAGSRATAFESSLGGFDLEYGVRLPVLEKLNPRAFIGFYHYSNEGVQSANGVRGRFETFLHPNVTAHVMGQNDGLFDTTLTAGFTVYFGRYARPGLDRKPADKFNQRVVRDPAIVVTRGMDMRRELLVDPADGEAIVVNHVSSSAAPGGDGSVENPFSSLTEAQNGSQPGDILLAHAGSIFSGQGIALQDGQRLLGEGIPHFITATQGTFQLPRATSNTGQPIIANSPTDAIVLASNTEVSGFTIQMSGEDAIDGDTISNVNINRTVISEFVDDGIDLRNVGGNNIIDSVQITATTDGGVFTFDDEGISLDYDGTTEATVVITNSTISGVGIEDGIDVRMDDFARLNLIVGGNRISDTDFGAVTVDFMFGNSFLDLVVANNTFENNGFTAFEIQSFDNSSFQARVTDNTFQDYFFDGLSVDMFSNSTGSIQVVGNRFETTSFFADAVFMDISFTSASLCAQVANNTTSEDFVFLSSFTPTFQLEDTIGTNVFQNFSSPFIDPNVMIVPEGFCGFPSP